MAAVLELQHNGKTWQLLVSDEEGHKSVEIDISDKDKGSLEVLGVEVYYGE
jgi:hypothetical protein